MMIRPLALRVLTVWLLSLNLAVAGGPLSVCNGTPTKYPGSGTVTLHYDQGGLGSRSKVQMDALVTAAVALWTDVPTASLVIQRGADLPVDVSASNATSYLTNFGDGLNPVIYDSDGSLIDALYGLNARNSILGFAGSASKVSGAGCVYTEGRAVISGALSLSDEVLKNVLAHEVGHLVGLDHTQINSAQGLPTNRYPLMYPTAYRTLPSLHEDDAAALTDLYPNAEVSRVFGEISGTFTQPQGTPILGANLWAQDRLSGKTFSSVSGYRQLGTGEFKLLLPEGTYTLHAEAIRSAFTAGSSVGPYSETSGDASFQPPLYSGGIPMAPLAFGNSSPTPISIQPGCTVRLNFRFDGTGTLQSSCTAGPRFGLTVVKAGTGSGTVSGSGVNCGPSCQVEADMGRLLTLSATPDPGSVFTGWSGAGCSGIEPCTLRLDRDETVTATFTASTPILTLDQTGSGTVSGAPGNLRCTGRCSVSMPQGATVTLEAVPNSGFYFSGWLGDCGGDETCLLTLDTSKTVSARFLAIPPGQEALSVRKTGWGQIQSQPGGILCSGTCNGVFPLNAPVELTPTPGDGFYFSGWLGDCRGLARCRLTMSSPRSVQALFEANPPGTQTVSVSLSGLGTVTSSPMGLLCGAACRIPFKTLTQVTLTATPESGQTFKGWGGACRGTGPCTLTVDSPKGVTASFSGVKKGFESVMPVLQLLLQ